MATPFENTLAYKFHTIFCYVVVRLTRYGGGFRSMVMSYSDPNIITSAFIIIGGSFINKFFLPIPLFVYLAFTFYKYNQKKLFYLYSIPIIVGLGYGINDYVEKTRYQQDSKIYYKYQDEIKKILCNEQSRLELSSLVIPAIKSKNQTNEQKDDLEKIKELASKNNKNKYKNLAEFSLSLNNDNLKKFVKKYPDFSNLEFRDRELSVNLNQISADWENFSRELRMGGNQFLQSRCNASR